jgi:hypothetical protein
MPKVPDSKPRKADDIKPAARRPGSDKDKDRFEAKLKKIAKAKPHRPSHENKAAWAKIKS